MLDGTACSWTPSVAIYSGIGTSIWESTLLCGHEHAAGTNGMCAQGTCMHIGVVSMLQVTGGQPNNAMVAVHMSAGSVEHILQNDLFNS